VRLEDLSAALQRMEAARPFGPSPNELPPTVALTEHSWTYSLQNSIEAIPPFVDVLLKRAASGLDRSAVLELSLALREMIHNAVEHGNLGLTYQEKSRAIEGGTLEQLLAERGRIPELSRRRVTVNVLRAERQLSVRIRDEGNGFDWRSLPDPTDTANLLSANGRGVLLAQLSVNALSYNEKGNEVTIVKTF
jgi:anti-sigma regulatory factor (Ser/Thr protein kinase)